MRPSGRAIGAGRRRRPRARFPSCRSTGGPDSPHEARIRPSGEKASHSAGARVPRQGRPAAPRERVPEDDAAGRVARGQGAAVGGQVDATDRRVVAAEQRDLAAAEPPEIPPGEVAMPGARVRRRRPAGPPGPARTGRRRTPGGPAATARRGGAGRPAPRAPRRAAAAARTPGVPVGPLDLAPSRSLCARSQAFDQAIAAGRARRDDHRQGRQGGVRRPAPRPLQAALPQPTRGGPGSVARPGTARGPRPAPRPRRSGGGRPCSGSAGRSSPGRGGRSGRSTRGAIGSSSMTWRIVSDGVSPRNGGRPVRTS